MYNAAGLPLHFSSFCYTKEELLSLRTQAAKQVLNRYGCLDDLGSKFAERSASNKQEIVTQLNIREEFIITYSDGKFFVDIDDELEKINKQHDNWPIKISKVRIYNLRVENIFNRVKVDYREQFAVELSRISALIKNIHPQQYILTNDFLLLLHEERLKLAIRLHLEEETSNFDLNFEITALNNSISKIQDYVLVSANRYFNRYYNDHMENIKQSVNESIEQLIDVSKSHTRSEIGKKARDSIVKIGQQIEREITQDFKKFSNDAINI